ncbi:hypothetical protein [Comamonas aquatica]|uniref:Holin n=1 Tax=Comamonas aquatica TaxID=225991 RepID=A0AA42L2Q3_9BURK|nr:hypothetical protein [Comamonas aquatica]MDH0362780.1 hypothetical protein [Comamonas aquatica]
MAMEPTTSAAVTLSGAAVSASAITAFGVPLGLHADVLLAGFFGSLVAIILLNTVPGAADTWQELLRTSVRRLAVAWASSITAGYITPLALLIAEMPQGLLLSMAFMVGAGAQRVLVAVMTRFWAIPKQEG